MLVSDFIALTNHLHHETPIYGSCYSIGNEMELKHLNNIMVHVESPIVHIDILWGDVTKYRPTMTLGDFRGFVTPQISTLQTIHHTEEDSSCSFPVQGLQITEDYLVICL